MVIQACPLPSGRHWQRTSESVDALLVPGMSLLKGALLMVFPSPGRTIIAPETNDDYSSRTRLLHTACVSGYGNALLAGAGSLLFPQWLLAVSLASPTGCVSPVVAFGPQPVARSATALAG